MGGLHTLSDGKPTAPALRAALHPRSVEAREASALELFRRGKLSHFELSQVLGLDRFQTDAYLIQHKVYEGSLTAEDLEADKRTLDRLLGPIKS